MSNDDIFRAARGTYISTGDTRPPNGHFDKPILKYLSECKLLDMVRVPITLDGYYRTPSEGQHLERSVNAIVLGQNKGSQCTLLGFESVNDTRYGESGRSSPSIYNSDLVDMSLWEQMANKTVWFSRVLVEVYGSRLDRSFINIKKFGETPIILARDIRIGDTVCVAANNNQLSYITVSDIEEGEKGELSGISLCGAGYRAISVGAMIIDQMFVPNDATVILIDRSGEE